jgi:hypothetical protein
MTAFTFPFHGGILQRHLGVSVGEKFGFSAKGKNICQGHLRTEWSREYLDLRGRQ